MFKHLTRTRRDRQTHKPSWITVAAALLPMANAWSAEAPTDAWQFELTPYVWGAAMKGDVQAGMLPRTTVDMSFADIVEVLDAAGMVAFEAWKDGWGVLLDVIYLEVSDSAKASRMGPAGNTLTATAALQQQMTLLSAAIAYRMAEGRAPVDILGGLRYVKNKVDVDIEASLFGQTGLAGRSGDKDWVDPYVGIRIQQPLFERWTLTAYADYGGFGVNSDSTWQVQLGLDYGFTDAVSAKFGYRVMNTDYDKGGFLMDMKTEGLYLGLGIRF